MGVDYVNVADRPVRRICLRAALLSTMTNESIYFNHHEFCYNKRLPFSVHPISLGVHPALPKHQIFKLQHYILPTAIYLQPPPADWQDALLDSLILRIQRYAGPQGYAVVKERTKKFKKTKLDRRAWIQCNRGGKPEKKLYSDSYLDLNTLRVYEIQSPPAMLLLLG